MSLTTEQTTGNYAFNGGIFAPTTAMPPSFDDLSDSGVTEREQDLWMTEDSTSTTATALSEDPIVTQMNYNLTETTSNPVWYFSSENATELLSTQSLSSTIVPSLDPQQLSTTIASEVRNVVIANCSSCSEETSADTSRQVVISLTATLVILTTAFLTWIVWRRLHRRRKEVINISISDRVQNFHLQPKAPALLPCETDNYHVVSFSQGPHPPVALTLDTSMNPNINIDYQGLTILKYSQNVLSSYL